TVNFTTPFIATPTVWPRVSFSWGAGNENPIAYAPTTTGGPAAWTPSVWLVAASQTQAVFETYVYQLFGPGQNYWWPIAPQGAFFAYTAVGPISLVGVGDAPAATALALSARPNPSRVSTTVEFSLPSATHGTLAVYDVGGRVVRNLESG